MEGYLGKKGKRMGSRVKRYMRLDGAILSNHHAAGAPPSWRVNIKDAEIGHNPKRHKVVIDLYNNKLELFAETSRECLQWYEALRNAKKNAALHEGPGGGSGARDVLHAGSLEKSDHMSVSRTMSESVDDRDDSKNRARAQIGKNFKVVKPPSRNVSSAESSGSDEAYEGAALVVQGQVYEETPASMIFKQFTFPAK